jgi:hypothetical protein
MDVAAWSRSGTVKSRRSVTSMSHGSSGVSFCSQMDVVLASLRVRNRNEWLPRHPPYETVMLNVVALRTGGLGWSITR